MLLTLTKVLRLPCSFLKKYEKDKKYFKNSYFLRKVLTYISRNKNGPLTQMVEYTTFNRAVSGSSPEWFTGKMTTIFLPHFVPYLFFSAVYAAW